MNTTINLSAFKYTDKPCKHISNLSVVSLDEIINYQLNLPCDKAKGTAWKVYPFISVDAKYHGEETGTYIGTNVQIIDVDSTNVYDYTIRNSQSLFEHMQNAVAIWPSHSGKLHLAVLTPSLVNVSGDMLKQEYARLYRLNMSRFVEWYESSSSMTIYDMKQHDKNSYICDCHNTYVYQAIFLNHIDQYAVNDNVIDITSELISKETEYATRYPIFFGRISTNAKSKTTAQNIGKTTGDEDVIYENRQPDGRYLVNRDFCLLGYRGNEARMRIATAILKACHGQMADAIMCIHKNFVDVDNELVTALKTAGNYKVDYDVYTWVKKNIVKVYEADKTIVIGEGKWLTDYQDEIMSHIHNGKNVYIKGSCGIGKSALYRSIFKSEKKVVIVTHMNSVRDGVFANSDEIKNFVVLISDATKIIRARRCLPRKMVMNWNTYASLIDNDKYRDEFDEYVKLFDESHNLAKSLDFRHEIIYKLGMHTFNRCIFCSATPVGEHMLLGSNVVKYEFNREHERKVNYKFMKMVDGQGNKVEHRKDYDYVSTIVRYVEERYDDYDAFLVFDNRNYLLLAEKFGNYCVNFCKDNKLQSHLVADTYTDLLGSDIDVGSGDMMRILDDNILTKKVIVTTTYGTEGVEIKQHETMTVNDDLTIDYEMHKISKVCAIIPIWNVSTTDVTQTINRFRGVDNVDCIFVQSDDARERMIAGVGKDISLDYMSQYANNDDVYAEVMSYEDMLYVDSSTNYARSRLQQKPDVILSLSQLQQQHKTYSSLTTSNIRLLYPEVLIEPHEYVVATNSSKYVSSVQAYNQFKSNNKCLIMMLSTIANNANKVNDINDIIEIARNYPCCDKSSAIHKTNDADSMIILTENWKVPVIHKDWYDYVRVIKEIQSDYKKMKSIFRYSCDNDSGVEISRSVKVGIWYLCEIMKRDNMLHLESVKTLLRNRYELHREHANERYTEPVGIDNEPQVKRNEERLKQYQRCLQKLLLDDDISVPNSEWISSLGNSKEVLDIYESVIQSSLYDCECNAVSSVRLDKKGRASVAQYKWQLNEDERVRFKSLKEAYDYIHPVISLATFSKKNYAQYVTRI